ncbi:hypothetical protein KFE25_002703 [Diacronema lutheri]|uniref:Fatty acid desaturase domain-containing protein n=1 Tax=Diacronema lutheri TaxID=2081491 RepID=A0A8J6CBT1_DIALT|nr:hypothetical protein KFE25_002703 [Diacronema lutheri]
MAPRGSIQRHILVLLAVLPADALRAAGGRLLAPQQHLACGAGTRRLAAAPAIVLAGAREASSVERSLPVRIDGQWYELGGWAAAHPGGAWLLNYQRGRDVSALFHSVHLRSASRAEAILRKLPTIEPSAVVGAAPFVFERDAARRGEAPLISGDGASVPVLRRSAFARDLQRLVDEEFPTAESAKADAVHWARIWLSLALAAWCWSGWFAGSAPAIALLPLCSWLLASQTCHEATHSTLSTRPWVNFALQFTAHPLLFNVFCWIPEHLTSHHQYTNDDAYDVDLHLFAPVRISEQTAPAADAAPFLGTTGFSQFLVKGALSTLGTSLLQPMRALCGLRTPNFGGNITPVPAPDVSRTMLAASMAPAAFTLLWPFAALALGRVSAPVALFQLAWPWIGASIIWTTMTQVSHIQAECQPDQPAVAPRGSDAACWWVRQAETSLDYSAGSPLVTALSAGLNSQSLHHALPMICSCHFPRIYSRFAQICATHGVRLRSVPDLPTAVGGLGAFVRRLNLPSLAADELRR